MKGDVYVKYTNLSLLYSILVLWLIFGSKVVNDNRTSSLYTMSDPLLTFNK